VTHVVFQQRELVSSIAAGTLDLADSACASLMGEPAMYGLIGKMIAAPGQRDALIAILLEGVPSARAEKARGVRRNGVVLMSLASCGSWKSY
jgi:hypothetical protein